MASQKRKTVFGGRAPRGVTLIELITVMGIMAVLAAMGAGTYIALQRDYTEKGALSQIQTALRQAHNSAAMSNAPAYVQINLSGEKPKVYPCLYKQVGYWQFEDRNYVGETTGMGKARINNANIVNDGKIGRAVELLPGGFVDLTDNPDFDCEDGGYIELYIRPGVPVITGDHYIFSKEGSYYLKMITGGYLQGNVAGKTVKSTYRVAPYRWTKVAFCWDRDSSFILADDAIVARGSGGKVFIGGSPLVVGHPAGSMIGRVDQMRVLTAVAGRPVELPRDVEVAHTARPWNSIHFAPGGTLDARYHPGEVKVAMMLDRRVRQLLITPLGEITELEMERIPLEEWNEDPRRIEARTAKARAQMKLIDEEVATQVQNEKKALEDSEKKDEKK